MSLVLPLESIHVSDDNGLRLSLSRLCNPVTLVFNAKGLLE